MSRELLLLKALDDEIRGIAREYGSEYAEPLKRRLHDLAGRVLDDAPDEQGAHLFVTRLSDDRGYLRLSALTDPEGFLRATIAPLGSPTVEYSFVADRTLRRHLELDNYRMELAVFPKIGDSNSRKARFCTFCLYATYQVEQALRYYYEQPSITPPVPKGKYLTFAEMLNDFGIAHYATSQKQQDNWYGQRFRIRLFAPLERMREIRNRLSHRLPLPKSEGDTYDQVQAQLAERTLPREDVSDAYLAKFIHDRSFDKVRDALREVVRHVRSSL